MPCIPRWPVALALALLTTLMPWQPGPLSPEAHATSPHAVTWDRPLMVMVHADWCPGCRKAAPAWASIQRRYQGQVTFVTLDVTTEASAAQAARQAEALGLGAWFQQNRRKTALTAIFSPLNPSGPYLFMAEPDPTAYAITLDTLLRQLEEARHRP